jgi:hypothetical protein
MGFKTSLFSGRHGLLLQLVSAYGPVMVEDIGGKLMGVVVFGDKIQILGIGREKGRLQRPGSRTGDRSGRKPLDAIGIVRPIRGQVIAGNIAVKAFDAIMTVGSLSRRMRFFSRL